MFRDLSQLNLFTIVANTANWLVQYHLILENLFNNYALTNDGVSFVPSNDEQSHCRLQVSTKIGE